MGRIETSDLKLITSEPKVGKAKPSTRAKWRSSLSACKGVEKKGLTTPTLLERRCYAINVSSEMYNRTGAMTSSWQLENGHIICRWSNVGQYLPYNPPWMEEAGVIQGSY